MSVRFIVEAGCGYGCAVLHSAADFPRSTSSLNFMLTARQWIVAYGVACSASLCDYALTAMPWPERPIRIVVPLPAGTSPDLFARHLGQKLSVRLKQPVIIENRPGANSVIGTAVVAKASPDGYTLLNASVQHVMLKPLLGKLAFD